MKFLTIFLFALMAGAILAGGKREATVYKDGIMGWDSGMTSDDWHEKTDVIRTSDTTKETKVDYEKSYQLKDGECLISEMTRTDGVKPEVKTVVEYCNDILPNGSIINKTITRTVAVDYSKKCKKIRRYWTKSYNLTSVASLVAGFTKKYALELTDAELALFNSIAVTDGNELESKYNYVQVKEEFLEPTLRKVLQVFKTPLCEADIKALANEIGECKDEAIVKILDTRPIEVDREDLWTVCLEVFFATCGKEIPAVQMFAWSGCKSGAYHKGLCSRGNRDVIDKIITRWLARHIYLLFTCKDVPVKEPCMCQKNDKKPDHKWK